MASPSSSDPDLTIVVEKNPPESRLAELGVRSWPKWGCPPGRLTLKFDAGQTSYFVKGKVKVYPKNPPENSPVAVEFGAGDLVFIPKGLSCTWDVAVAVDKFYKFDPLD